MRLKRWSWSWSNLLNKMVVVWMVAARWLQEANAGLSEAHFPSDNAWLCITRSFGVELSAYPPPNASALRGGQVAFLGNLSHSDAACFCKGEASFHAVRDYPYRDQWMVVEAVWGLCGFDAPMRRTVEGAIRDSFAIAHASLARGLLWVFKGDPDALTAYHTPGVAMAATYSLPTIFDPLVARSVNCASWPPDPSGRLGALSGFVRGVPVGELRFNITVEPTPWKATFEHPAYTFTFSVGLPLLCGIQSAVAIQSFRDLRRRQRAVTVPVIVLGIESVVQFLNAVYYAVTGHFARQAPYWYYSLCLSGFSGAGMATTFLTAFVWYDLKRTCFQHTAKPIVARQFKTMVGISALFSTTDVLAAISIYYFIPWFDKATSALYVVCQLGVAAYFVVSVSTSLRMLNQTIRRTQRLTQTSRHTERLHRAGKWLFLSSACMVVYGLTLGIMGVSGYIWEPRYGWPIASAIVFYARWGTSFTQVMAVRPSKLKRKVQHGVATPARASSTHVSSAGSSRSLTQQSSSLSLSSVRPASTGLSTLTPPCAQTPCGGNSVV